MVDMKSLERAVKAEGRSGYDLIVSGETFTFIGGTWLAVTSLERLREEGREVLSLLVEQLGFIPDAIASRITKERGEYIEQPIMQEVVGESVAGFVGEALFTAKPTPLVYRGWPLWAAVDGKLYGVTRGPIWNGFPGDMHINERGCLCAEADGDALYRRTVRPGDGWTDEAHVEWDYLEDYDWSGKEGSRG